MSSPLAHLMDVFDTHAEPDAALLCTYGFDAPFFEAEILPAIFSRRLVVDRQSGSQAPHLNAADNALRGRTVAVFYDHLLTDGPQFPYLACRVNVAPRAFPPKLILLDYRDHFRVVVSSANLTRPAWTTLLETFVFEDLWPGTPHSWADTIQR